MFELLVTLLFVWLFIKVIGLVLKLTWGTAKVIAGILCVLALPILILVLLFAGGAVLLLPVGLVIAAFAVVKACV